MLSAEAHSGVGRRIRGMRQTQCLPYLGHLMMKPLSLTVLPGPLVDSLQVMSSVGVQHVVLPGDMFPGDLPGPTDDIGGASILPLAQGAVIEQVGIPG